MAVSTRIIRRRIKSVAGTRKITKAMELVAASKMRKAVSAAISARPYTESAWLAVEELARVSDSSLHPLLAVRPKVQRRLLIVFTSDRGLCGGFNSQLLKVAWSFLKNDATPTDLIAIGKKGQSSLLRSGHPIVATFTDLTNNARVTDIRPIADLAIKEFIAGTYDQVHLAFTDYRSALVQKPLIKQLLPLIRADETPTKTTSTDFLFEPSPARVLDAMLPRLVEAQVYQVLLEAAASEHSARMMAMRSASDAASDMLDDLTLTYTQARQAGITREIAEISSGKAALE